MKLSLREQLTNLAEIFLRVVEKHCGLFESIVMVRHQTRAAMILPTISCF